MLRGLGWLLIGSGVLIALYLVYSLYWTGLETQAHQDRLLDDWELQVGAIEEAVAVAPAQELEEWDLEVAPAIPSEDPTVAQEATPPLADVDVGEAVAALQFVRPGGEEPPVHEGPLLVVEGVTDDALRAGPGHYPSTAMPGEPGNFAVAGHRTTYGAPFFNLDELVEGDQIHVVDRHHRRWVYEVVLQEVVPPDADHVLVPDPLGNDLPTLTLTTCTPRFSNTDRLIVYAQLTGTAAATA